MKLRCSKRTLSRTAVGHERRFRGVLDESAFPLKLTVGADIADGRLCPHEGHPTFAQQHHLEALARRQDLPSNATLSLAAESCLCFI